MSEMSTYLIIGLIIFGFWFYTTHPDDPIVQKISGKKETQTDTKKITETEDEEDAVVQNSNQSINTSNTTVTYPDNPCGAANFGLPSYENTEKEGLSCRDAIPTERDKECVLHPPSGYNGVTDTLYLTSTPMLECCISDPGGYCIW